MIGTVFCCEETTGKRIWANYLAAPMEVVLHKCYKEKLRKIGAALLTVFKWLENNKNCKHTKSDRAISMQNEYEAKYHIHA